MTSVKAFYAVPLIVLLSSVELASISFTNHHNIVTLLKAIAVRLNFLTRSFAQDLVYRD